MKIVVMVKQVPDAENVELDPQTGNIRRDGAERMLNPYCEFALQAAVSLREEGDVVVVVTMGPRSAEEALRYCLERGADRAYLLTDKDFAGSDAWATATVLSRFLQLHEPDHDIVLTGRQAIDGDTGQVPAELAVISGLEPFYHVRSVSKQDGMWRVTQDYGDEVRELMIAGSCVLSIASGSLEPKVPSMVDVQEAQGKPLKVLDRESLDLKKSEAGLAGSRTRVVKIVNQVHTRASQKLQGTPAEMADGILQAGGWI
ncbi:MAG: electron transfer flavoprotein subunit beta/FixA family protein [Candidatus Methanomethylophilaceae archaeon]|nr:electron transfer flavoprotein subunit beta/FixA family protein [Candidatus Methanomethylophilaceae archaeon]